MPAFKEFVQQFAALSVLVSGVWPSGVDIQPNAPGLHVDHAVAYCLWKTSSVLLRKFAPHLHHDRVVLQALDFSTWGPAVYPPGLRGELPPHRLGQ